MACFFSLHSFFFIFFFLHCRLLLLLSCRTNSIVSYYGVCKNETLIVFILSFLPYFFLLSFRCSCHSPFCGSQIYFNLKKERKENEDRIHRDNVSECAVTTLFLVSFHRSCYSISFSFSTIQSLVFTQTDKYHYKRDNLVYRRY